MKYVLPVACVICMVIAGIMLFITHPDPVVDGPVPPATGSFSYPDWTIASCDDVAAGKQLPPFTISGECAYQDDAGIWLVASTI